MGGWGRDGGGEGLEEFALCKRGDFIYLSKRERRGGGGGGGGGCHILI